MGNKEEENLFYNLSRKELQYFCKKYSLPANRSHSDLAKSLASYFQTNAGSILSGDKLGGIQDASVLRRRASLNPTAIANKDCCAIVSAGEEGRRGLHCETVKSGGLDCFMGAKPCVKDVFGHSIYNLQETLHSTYVPRCDVSAFAHRDGRLERMPQVQIGFRNGDALPNGNAFASVNTSRKATSPSFEFYVKSEEGINLCVDLTSSPSEWTERLKNEVHICENTHNKKCQSHNEDLGLLGSSNEQIKSSFQLDVDAGKSENDTLKMENGFHRPDEGDGSFMSPAVIPCIEGDVSERLEEDEAVFSSKPNNDVNQIISDSESRPKDQDGCTISIDSDVIDTSQIKSVGNSHVEAISNGPKSILLLEHQYPILCNEICGTSTGQNNYTSSDPSAAFPGCLTSGTEMQLSEVASYHTSCSPCQDGEVPDLVDPVNHIEAEQGGPAKSNVGHDTCRNYFPTSAEAEELLQSNIIDGKERSVCSHMNNSLENTYVSLDDLESREEPSKKRPHIDVEDQNVCCKPDAKIIRNTKQLAGEVPPRRSMRFSP